VKRLSGEILKAIGAEVRRRRQEAGYSLERLAALASLHKNHVSRVELGQADLSISALWSIALALQCEVADLVPSTRTAIRPEVLAAARALVTAIEDPGVRVAITSLLDSSRPAQPRKRAGERTGGIRTGTGRG